MKPPTAGINTRITDDGLQADVATPGTHIAQSELEGFLVQILLQLKGYGLVSSVRGAGGGYRLNRPPQDVTLLDVLEMMEGDDSPSSSCGKSSPLSATFLDLRQELCQSQRERLGSITLSDLVEQATATAEPMWYI